MTNLVVLKYTRLTMLFSLLLFQLVKWLVDNLSQSQKKADMRKLYDEGNLKSLSRITIGPSTNKDTCCY